ncbi:TPA: TatD family deoxyribonuclease [Vibrio parahaemolyticus]|uniref:TatD family hydrolase n=1 Tax=Vibrio parahaemolyticus TaxID=670 RepID=A0AA46UPM3_VIBPH|nr:MULTISPECIES: Qat anti-phage system TatD family nuclease QatD [Vibrio]EHH3740601.1 TatD family hydrolase [Vibrio parahaemolyticus]EIU6780532.1 TatD family hydrolase [Vibrio parahaemolyticus]MCC3849979.1 TatD family hydrolase [Vibrio parahaemolyticus]NNN56333.1 TatD family deoxyribonuclease [Vibrio sp. 1-2 (7-a)]ODX19145.1 hydrolase TatD [Vibrio parahaemolyticus]
MIDFHCHLDLYSNCHEVAEEVRKRGIYLLSVTTTPSAFDGTRQLEGDGTRIRTALGLHPQLAHERISELGLFEELVNETKYIGEIGLDGSKEFRSYFEPQHIVLDKILESCTRSGGKILSVHSRGAASEVLSKLRYYADAGIPVLHWFTGTKSQLQTAIDLGCWFSIGPAMLMSKRSVELVTMIPKNRILTETDGPFARLHRSALMPWDVEVVEDQLAKLWEKDTATTKARLYDNLRTLVQSI